MSSSFFPSIHQPAIIVQCCLLSPTIVNGKSGFLYENNSPESLAENLNKVIEMDKSKLQSIGNEGRKNVLKKFDVEQMCYSTFLEYKKLIK